MMKGKVLKLGDFCDFNANSYSGGECWNTVCYLDTGSIEENRISGIQMIDLSRDTLPSRARRKVVKDSILYSTVRPNQRHFGILRHTMPENMLVSTGFAVIDVHEDAASAEYIYYWLRQDSIIEYLQNLAEQSVSAYPSIKASDIAELTIKLPSLPTQRKIAAVLSSLDDKIETNNAICRNLEEMSRCVLSEWLTAEARNVEYIPLSELADINAKTYSEKEKWPFVYYLDTGSITNGRVDSLAYIDVNKEKLPSRARRKISMGDIVYSTVRPTQRHFGIIYDVQPNMLVSTGFAVICSNCTDVCNELIYIMLTEPTFVESMQQIGEQSVSTYPSVNPADIATCSIPVSKEVSYQKIQDVIQSNFKKIGDLQKENCRLAALRDTLLPRLMSGELGVSAVNLR